MFQGEATPVVRHGHAHWGVIRNYGPGRHQRSRGGQGEGTVRLMGPSATRRAFPSPSRTSAFPRLTNSSLRPARPTTGGAGSIPTATALPAPGPAITSSAAGVVFAYGGDAVLGAGRWALRVARYAGGHGVYAGLATTCAVCGGAGPGCCSVACTAGRAMRWAWGRYALGTWVHPPPGLLGLGVPRARA